jgi:hypothetical protein
MQISLQSNAGNLGAALSDLAKRFPLHFDKAMKSAGMRLRKDVQTKGPKGAAPMQFKPLDTMTKVRRKMSKRGDSDFGMPAMWKGVYVKPQNDGVLVAFGPKAAKGARYLLEDQTGTKTPQEAQTFAMLASVTKQAGARYVRPQRPIFEPLANDAPTLDKFVSDVKERIEKDMASAARKAAKAAKLRAA